MKRNLSGTRKGEWQVEYLVDDPETIPIPLFLVDPVAYAPFVRRGDTA